MSVVQRKIGGKIFAMYAEVAALVDDLIDERDELARLIAEHNSECERLCGIGDDAGVRCGYRPYFPRHCPECPLRNWTIEVPTPATGSQQP